MDFLNCDRLAVVKYLQALKRVKPLEIIADYAQQIMEISNIYRFKVYHVNRATEQLLWSSLPWFLLIGTFIIDPVLPVVITVVPKVYLLLVITGLAAILGRVLIKSLNEIINVV